MKLRDYRAHLKALSVDDLHAELRTVEQELFNIRLNIRAGRVKNYSYIAVLRCNIARIKTILHAQQSGPINDMQG